VLIPVKYLINGTTIRQETVSRITYYHVELDQHDVILAEGLPAETYLDVGDRSNFANGGVLVRLHVSLADTWEMRGAAPLVITGPLLERVRQRVQTGTAERRVG
jgi:collagen type I alpha